MKYFLLLEFTVIALSSCTVMPMRKGEQGLKSDVYIKEIIVETHKPSAQVYKIDQEGNRQRLGTTDNEGNYVISGLTWQEGIYSIEVVDKNDIRSWTPPINVKGTEIERKIGATPLVPKIIEHRISVEVIIKECNQERADVYSIDSMEKQTWLERTGHPAQDKIFYYSGYWKKDTYRIMVTKSGFKPWTSKDKWEVKDKPVDILIQKAILEQEK